jgi:hypothetical protein
MNFTNARQLGNNATAGCTTSFEQQFLIAINVTHKQLQSMQLEFCLAPSILFQLDAINRQLQVLDPHIRAVQSPLGTIVQCQLVDCHMKALVTQIEILRLQIFGPQKPQPFGTGEPEKAEAVQK